MIETSPLRIGTRGSALARWQAEWVAAQLRNSGVAVELAPISTRGDRQQSGTIAAIGGGEGVFTKELQRALLAEEVDLAVHSLKDLPTEVVAGLALAAVPERGPNGDVLVTPDGRALDNLPQGATVGTGSLRRRAQLWHARPDLQMADVRGNVDTRLKKVLAGEFDALVLAEAGLTRLGLGAELMHELPKTVMLPAVGQGALGIEARADDARTLEALAALDHQATHRAVLAERAMLSAIRGGCLAPVGAWGRVEGDGRLCLDAVVLSGDGRTRLLAAATGKPADAEAIGRGVAEDLLKQGAAELIRACRR